MHPFVEAFLSPARVGEILAGEIASFNATLCLHNQICLGQVQVGRKGARIAIIPQSAGILCPFPSHCR